MAVGLLKALGIDSKNYPNKIGSLTAEQITNVPAYDDKSWKRSLGYEFSVVEVDKKSNKIKDTKLFGFSLNPWSPFRLQINPQELNQDEIFAIQVTPTFRGVIVEHQGVTIKDIKISGTTGISPNRREGGAFADSGNPVFQDGHSGYEEFHELRSYFRMYTEAKRQEVKNKKTELRMIFANYVDNEFLWVEPQKFSMKRQKGRPFMRDYMIDLKAIGVASSLKQDSGWLDYLLDSLESIQDYLDAASKVLTAGFAIIAKFQRSVASTVLGPLQAVNAALAAIRGGLAMNFGQFGITRRFCSDLKKELENLESNFADVLGRNTAFNAAAKRTPTLSSPTTRAMTYDESSIMNSIGKSKRGLSLLLAQPDLFEANIYDQSVAARAIYPGVEFNVPNSVTTATIGGGDTIQIIALRELGDIDLFKEIVILNNLKPPYISPSGSPSAQGVLREGDKILIPQAAASTASSVAKGQSYNITKDMKQAEIDLGVDIRLTEERDLAIANTQDLDLIAGVENFIQAIDVRLFLESGGLKRHLSIGTDLQLGRKVKNSTGLNGIRKQILDSLNSDPRVESIPSINLKQEGGTLQVNMVLKAKEIEQPVPLPLVLNVN